MYHTASRPSLTFSYSVIISKSYFPSVTCAYGLSIRKEHVPFPLKCWNTSWTPFTLLSQPLSLLGYIQLGPVKSSESISSLSNWHRRIQEWLGCLRLPHVFCIHRIISACELLLFDSKLLVPTVCQVTSFQFAFTDVPREYFHRANETVPYHLFLRINTLFALRIVDIHLGACLVTFCEVILVSKRYMTPHPTSNIDLYLHLQMAIPVPTPGSHSFTAY